MPQNPAPTESEIAAAVRDLRTADVGTLAQVEPLARQLPREAFAATVERLKRRCASGSVTNDSGLFITLLELELRQCRLRRAAEPTTSELPLGLVDKTKRDEPERYVRAMLGRPGFDLEVFLAVYVTHEAARERLRGIARQAAA